jgi:hypothetical protein
MSTLHDASFSEFNCRKFQKAFFAVLIHAHFAQSSKSRTSRHSIFGSLLKVSLAFGFVAMTTVLLVSTTRQALQEQLSNHSFLVSASISAASVL